MKNWNCRRYTFSYTNVVLSESGLELFEGNSFLSLYTMLKEENSK